MSTMSDYFYKGPSFTLVGGREIRIQSLYQTLTYAHVLEGIPYGPSPVDPKQLHLKWAQDEYPGRKIIVLEPRMRPLAIDPPELEKLRERWKKAEELKKTAANGGTLTHRDHMDMVWPEPVCIGSVCCRALFESSPVDRDKGMLSELFVIWFQDGFAMPIDTDVTEQIRSIVWEAEAVDTDL